MNAFITYPINDMVIFGMSRQSHFSIVVSMQCSIVKKLWIIIAISKWCLKGRSCSSQAAGRVFQTLSKRKAISTSYTQDRDPGTPAFHSALIPSFTTLMGILSRILSLAWIYNRQRHSGFLRCHGQQQARGPSSHLSTWSREFSLGQFLHYFFLQALKKLTWGIF